MADEELRILPLTVRYSVERERQVVAGRHAIEPESARRIRRGAFDQIHPRASRDIGRHRDDYIRHGLAIAIYDAAFKGAGGRPDDNLQLVRRLAGKVHPAVEDVNAAEAD